MIPDMSTSRMQLWEKMAEMESREESLQIDEEGMGRSSLWLSVRSRTRDKQGAGYQEIIGRLHNEERQVVLPDGLRFRGVRWSWIFDKEEHK